MNKVATTWNAVQIAPSTFWLGLLLSGVIVNSVASQAIAKEVTNLARATVPQKDIASVSAAEETLTTQKVNVFFRSKLHQIDDATHNFPSSAALPRASQPVAVEKVLTADQVNSVSQPKLYQVKGDSSKIPSTSALPSALKEVALDRADFVSQPQLHQIADATSNFQSSEAQLSVSKEANPVVASSEPLTTDEMKPDADPTAEQVEGTDDGMAQVTNVSQLRDVRPGDWAYEALRELVERYGCIAGYPDGTYRGNRAMTRYEFAAGLRACLNQIEKLIAGNTSGFASKEDLEKLRRLTQEFQGELATLNTRVDKLDGRVGFLEAHQFSTTTKLNGLAWFNVTGAFAARRGIKVEANDLSFNNLALRTAGRDPLTGKPVVQRINNNPSVTLSDLVWLTFQTSFTGKDSLVTQLAVGNGNSPANYFVSAGQYNTSGVPFLDQTGGFNTGVNDVVIRDFFYRFPVTNNLQLVVGPRVNFYRFFDNNAFNFFLTGTSTFNSNGSTLLNAVDRGAGVVALLDISKRIRLRAAYLAESDEYLPPGLFNTATDPTRGRGLFGGTNTTTVELDVSPTDRINLRFLYNRSNLAAIFGQIGGATGEPLYGLADDGVSGGGLRNSTADTFVFNFDWLVTSRIGLFGRYSYGSTHLKTANASLGRPGDVNAQSLQLGLAFPDLGKKGSLLTLSYLTPFAVLKGRDRLISNGGNGGVEYDLEAAYYFPLSNNIALVPAFYFIGHANNFSNNPGIYVGNLRAQFSF